MDPRIAKQLIDQTQLLLRDDATEWNAVEALRQPYIDQGDIDAQFHLADFYFDYSWGEGAQKEIEMKNRIRRAAERGHADATYRLRH